MEQINDQKAFLKYHAIHVFLFCFAFCSVHCSKTIQGWNKARISYYLEIEATRRNTRNKAKNAFCDSTIAIYQLAVIKVTAVAGKWSWHFAIAPVNLSS